MLFDIWRVSDSGRARTKIYNPLRTVRAGYRCFRAGNPKCPAGRSHNIAAFIYWIQCTECMGLEFIASVRTKTSAIITHCANKIVRTGQKLNSRESIRCLCVWIEVAGYNARIKCSSIRLGCWQPNWCKLLNNQKRHIFRRQRHSMMLSCEISPYAPRLWSNVWNRNHRRNNKRLFEL